MSLLGILAIERVGVAFTTSCVETGPAAAYTPSREAD